METTRQLKIARLIQKELAEYFRGEIGLADHGSMISVTQVRMSPDLSQAKSYISVFPSSRAEEIVKLLEEKTKMIRFELGKKIGKQVRHIPELRFYLDDSLDYVDRISELLK
ncbi:MAG: 30S ribosome-binding factor RbfA [Porphyromonadaceae bacterium]|nr:MAG: 30S ribosome-binding factor RbfA [Porphyromonadaceae bacterium]